jgi:hypothetical protein
MKEKSCLQMRTFFCFQQKFDYDLKKGGSLKKKMAKRFEYQSDFDENGLLYYIGTNGGKEEWKNPVATGKVKIEISHDKMYSQEMRKEVLFLILPLE